MRYSLSSLYVITFITGAAGLIYEVTWQKYLSRLLGSDNIASAIILATFLGGLSFGYYACGLISTRVKNHLKIYAFVEGVIGIWCIFFPNIFSAVESLTRAWSFAPPFLIVVQGFFSSFLAIGVPTICMGSSIPFLTRGISRNIKEATQVHATVYAINTAGAFCGTLVAGFYLIPNYGLPLTIMGASIINIGSFLVIYFISGIVDSPSVVAAPDDRTAADSGSIRIRYPAGVLFTIAALSGFYVMTLENVLIRITNFSLGSSSYSFSLIVSVFILAIAVGSYTVGKLRRIPRSFLFLNQLLITFLLLLVYITLDTWPYYAHLIRAFFQPNSLGFWGYYTFVFIALVLILILPVSFIGATIPLLFHEIKRDLPNVGRHSGTLLSLNTAGNLCGSLVGGIAVFYYLNNAEVFLAACLFASLSAAMAGRYLSRRHFIPVLALSVLILAAIFQTPFYNYNHFKYGTFQIRTATPYSLRGPGVFFANFQKTGTIKYYKDGPTATVAVVEGPMVWRGNIVTSRSIVVNGKSDSSTIGDIKTLKLSAHLPALLASKKESVMVIGLGTGVTAGELSLYPDIKHIHVAEISTSVIEALPYFSSFNHNVGKDPRLHIHAGDAFRILTRSQHKWDLIISEPSNPWTSGVDLLFTREFYQQVKRHLSENGIFVQWAHVYSASDAMVGMIVNTLQHEFRYIRAFVAEKGDLILVAANESLSDTNIRNAEATLCDNQKVRASLESINLGSIESILVREIWPHTYISENFSDYGMQTLDNPRLHYMAGKSFFTGKTLPDDFLFNSASIKHLSDYLMLLKHRNWTDLAVSDGLAQVCTDPLTGEDVADYYPLVASLKLKAFISNPEAYPLDLVEQAVLRVELLPFIERSPVKETDWNGILPKEPLYRKKAQALLWHIQHFRNWIVPYPIEGVKELLQKGILQGADIYERNWCALSLAMILCGENAGDNVLAKVLSYTTKGKDGRILVRDQDEKLLKSMERLLATRKRKNVG